MYPNLNNNHVTIELLRGHGDSLEITSEDLEFLTIEFLQGHGGSLEVTSEDLEFFCSSSPLEDKTIAVYLQKYKTKKMKFVRVYSDFIEELDFPIPGVESAERKFTRDIEEVQKTDIQKDSLHHLIRSRSCKLSGKINQMYKTLKEGTLDPTLQNIRKYKSLVKNAKIKVLKEMEVILCTCSASGHFILKENLDILQCVIDEAGMCFELDTLVPLVCHTPKQVVLIGDHKQLRPIVQEPRVKQLGADISLMEKYQGTAHTLSIQYRMVRVAKYLVDQRKVKPEDVAILSQYKLQCNIIHKMLQKTHPKIKVQTIIKSQGSEWDYVLLSTVRSLPEDEIPETPGKSWRRTNLGFIEDENQMNVGITRAMQGLIIIGNRNLLKTCKIWRKLLEHFENIHAVIPADQFLAKGAQKTKKTSS
ncbi:putative helicase with zinc finger domain 2 [Apostichopus japonicus]|uniref:Putative helicase with zinc finger domain 2 n=1 Tax=Stichopus japonicus TaxID=307972 RepID=A0A2G8K559_STIJA|nr:putative helicase with zinc finger domain 2 [Apostichopus japonicus]